MVESAEAPVLSKGEWRSHRIEGIGDGFVPDNLDLSVVDGVILVSSREAIEMARRMSRGRYTLRNLFRRQRSRGHQAG